MTISFSGDYPQRSRVVTGWSSFDLAVSGNLQKDGLSAYGMPLRCGYHVYSKDTGVGKTTVSLSIMGKLSQVTKRNVAFAAIDTFDRGMAENILTYSGLDSNAHFILQDDHNAALTELKAQFSREDTVATLLDSIASLTSTAEAEGGVEDANMGRRAKMLAVHVKQIYGALLSSKTDKAFFLTNMLFANLGSIGYHPSGGLAPRQLTSIHLKLDRTYHKKWIEYPEGRLLTGKVEKNNFGKTGQEFNFFVLGGYGIHTGMTAVFDCLSFGYASEGRSIQLNDKKYGSLKDMASDAHDEERFEPFIQTMQQAIPELIAGRKMKELESDE